ncbi:MAG: energy transducer TonB [Candidatus Zixiibacteriota bacterium]
MKQNLLMKFPKRIIQFTVLVFCYTLGQQLCFADLGEVPEALDLSTRTDVDSLPHLKVRFATAYPPLALNAGIAGRLELKILVNETGKVRGLVFTRHSGSNAGLEEVAMASLCYGVWIPAYKDRAPVDCWADYHVEFLCFSTFKPHSGKSRMRINGLVDELKQDRAPATVFEPRATFDQPPRLLKSVAPAYDLGNAKDHALGSIWLKVLIDTNGVVRDVMVTQSYLNDSKLEGAVVDAANEYIYAPARLRGESVAVWFEYQVVLGWQEIVE